MREFKRRELLRLCGLAGLSLATPIFDPNSQAAEQESKSDANENFYDGPYFLVFNASGGWDTTYLMDPKGTEGINRLYKTDDIQTAGNHHYAPIAKQIDPANGISNQTFFEKYANELLTINGMDYSVNNHSPCMRYMATGKLDSLVYPTFAALVAACQGPNCPVAFLTFGNYSGTGNIVPMARVPYLPTLKQIANAGSVEGNVRSPYHDDFAISRIEKALLDQKSDREKQPRLPREARTQSTLFAAQQNSKSLGRITPFIPKQIPKARLAQQAEIALAAFKAGVCVSANLSIGQFDSHANNDRDQMKLIPEFLAGVDYALRRAEDLGIRDKIVVVMQSEMGRTPNYNAGNGKDHWSIGSAMFMGAGIQGNRVIGATDEKQFLIPIDPKKLSLDKENGIRVRPEHIHVALRQLAGISKHKLAKQFPMDVDETEELVGLWSDN